MFSPDNLEIAMVSFEGPDQYSQAGGLGVRAREMCRAFAALGYMTRLFFVGDPMKPSHEMDQGVELVRCIREVSRQYEAGVYQGEEDKLAALELTLPLQLVDHIVRPAAAAGRVVAVLCEEWQTAALCIALHRMLLTEGLRDHCLILWNANNHFGFDRIDWPALDAASAITTVSRYMKHLMWPQGVNPVVIPNGIPQSALVQPDPEDVKRIRIAAATPCLAFKIGRFSADKNWHQALDAIAELRRGGMPARMLMRGGVEAFGGEVMGHAHALGLEVATWYDPALDAAGVARALAGTGGAPLVNLASFLPDSVIPPIDVAATAVLANSGHEPFGLVGLEAMACGAIALVGATGEEYARSYANSIVIETNDGSEVASALTGLVQRPALARRLRHAARRDAEDFLWPSVIDGLIERFRFLSVRQEVDIPEPPKLQRRRLTGSHA